MGNYCRLCGTENDEKAEFCKKCGRRLQMVNKEKYIDKKQKSTSENTIVQCPFCLENVNGAALKCKYCGEWIKKTKNVDAITWGYVSLIVFFPLAIVFSIYLLTQDDPRARHNGFAIILASFFIFLVLAILFLLSGISSIGSYY